MYPSLQLRSLNLVSFPTTETEELNNKRFQQIWTPTVSNSSRSIHNSSTSQRLFNLHISNSRDVSHKKTPKAIISSTTVPATQSHSPASPLWVYKDDTLISQPWKNSLQVEPLWYLSDHRLENLVLLRMLHEVLRCNKLPSPRK